MKRDLYVSAFAPTLGSGRALRTYSCVRALAALGPVDLAYVPVEREEPCPEYLAIEGLRFHRIEPSRGAQRALTYAAKRLQGAPSSYCRGTSPELIREAARLAGQPGRGRVIAGDAPSATALMGRRRPGFVFNAHNIEAVYHSAPRPGSAREWRARERFERRLLAAADETWVVSPLDLDAARAAVPGARLRYVPNAVDVAAITPAPARTPGGRDLLMVADFSYLPNQSGRRLVVEDVLPLVWAQEPETRLTLVGRGQDGFQPPDPRVRSVGFVDDLAACYAGCDAVVVPLTEGGGSPLKFVEALAYGVPVVATPLAARGLDVVAGEHYLEGTDPASFAAAVGRILREGGAGLAAQGRRLAEEQYSIEALSRRLAA